VPTPVQHRRDAGHATRALTIALLASLALAAPAEASLQRKAKSHAREEADKGRPKIPPGQLHIVITIATQRVAVYSDGVLAARSVVATGVPGHATPTGAFSVIGKERYHASNIYSGAPMPFMQRITWSGVALHQGVVPGRPASHGCIRLTGDFAQLMWNATKVGARVIIAQDEVAPAAFAHAKLFAPRSKPILSEVERTPTGAIKTAEAAITASDAPPVVATEPDAAVKDLDRQESKKELVQPNAPISIFISAKEKRLFVRQAFLPIFDAPITISDADRPLGTHVFTALADSDPAKLRWLLVTLPDNPKPERKAAKSGKHAAKNAMPAEEGPAPSAAEALDRLDIPAETRLRVDDMITAGASLIVSDQGLGEETGEGTDFIVVTR
jgi:hypothetical protein